AAAQPPAQLGGEIVERLDLVGLHLAKRLRRQGATSRQRARALVASALRIIARLLAGAAVLARLTAARALAAAAPALAFPRPPPGRGVAGGGGRPATAGRAK